MNAIDMLDDYFIGRALKDFVAVEDSIRAVGKCMDDLSYDSDNVNTLEIASTMLIKLTSSSLLLQDFIACVNDYVDVKQSSTVIEEVKS